MTTPIDRMFLICSIINNAKIEDIMKYNKDKVGRFIGFCLCSTGLRNHIMQPPCGLETATRPLHIGQ